MVKQQITEAGRWLHVAHGGIAYQLRRATSGARRASQPFKSPLLISSGCGSHSFTPARLQLLRKAM